MRNTFVLFWLLVVMAPPIVRSADDADVVDIGSRRELFVDTCLIESLNGAQRRLHHPVARDVVTVNDKPWEGAGSGYHSIIHDGDIYRMYYRGSALGVAAGKLKLGPQVYCYAESRDGKTWSKPNLGLFAHGGSKQNNIILTGLGCHNFAPFLDANPACQPDARFKALGGTAKEGGCSLLSLQMEFTGHYYRRIQSLRWVPSIRRTWLSGIQLPRNIEPTFAHSRKE